MPSQAKRSDVSPEVRSTITDAANEIVRFLVQTSGQFGELAATLDPSLRTAGLAEDDPELGRRLDRQVAVTKQIADRARPYVQAALTRALEEHVLASDRSIRAVITRDAAESTVSLPPLTRANAERFAAEIIEKLGDNMPCYETAFPGFETQYGESDEEYDRIGRDTKPLDDRFLRILQASGVLEAALARATGSAGLPPPAQADGTFPGLALEVTEASLWPYFPPAAAEVLVPKIADVIVDGILAALDSRQLIVASVEV